MTNGLNLTLRIKQAPETLQRLEKLKRDFATEVQPVIDAALKKSRIVHFARVLVIDDKYLQVITSYDGDKRVYTEFFRRELLPVFKAIFSFAEGVTDLSVLDDEGKFYDLARSKNVRALGASHDKDPEEGYLFNAYPELTVEQILTKFGQQ